MEDVLLTEPGFVRVTRVVLQPGESTGRQYRLQRVIVHLDDHVKSRTTFTGAAPIVDDGVMRRAGDVHVKAESEHEITNQGVTPVTSLIIEVLR